MVPLLLIAIVGLVNGASYSDILSELNGLYDLDPGYYDNFESRSSPSDWGLSYRDAALNEPELLGEAALRDQEYLEQSPLWGYQSVSGGNGGGGKDNPNKEEKSDKVLPAYCNPPNPCPIGYTSNDNCVETFANTPENNRNLMKRQDCPCDAEHMLSCPNDKGRINTQDQEANDLTNILQNINLAGSQGLNLDDLQGMNLGGSQDMNLDGSQGLNLGESQNMDIENALEDNPYFGTAEDRISRVAKKSPHMVKKRAAEVFTGQVMQKDAKKRLAKKSGWENPQQFREY